MMKRQKYHLEPDRGLLNDPNGLVFYKGLYHVFFQWNRFEKNHSYKEWGHFTSRDLVQWNWEGSALVPDQPYEQNGVYSGSALEIDDQLYLFYTGNDKSGGARKSSQCLAVTKDGKTFQKKGIILGTPSDFTEHFRDPKVWKKDENYYMVVGAQKKNGKGAVALCSSRDGMNWNYQGVLAESEKYEMIECPDCFQIDEKEILLYCLQHRDNEKDSSLSSFSAYQTVPVDLLSGNLIYVQNSKSAIHRKKEKQIWNLDEGCRMLDQGFDFYAPQTFTAPDGRKILFAWMSRMEQEEEALFSQGEPSIHCMTLPRELSYREGELCQLPVRELEERLLRKNVDINEGQERDIEFENRVYCVKFLRLQNETSFTVEIQKGEVILEYREKMISVKRKNWVTKAYDERSCKVDLLGTLEIWSDISSIEIFINHGNRVFSMRVFSEEKMGEIKMNGISEEAVIEMYDLITEEGGKQ